MISRIKQALLHTLLGKLITFLNPLLLIPMYIYHWGIHTYAIWLILLGIASYVDLVDFGLSHYFPNKVTILKNKNKQNIYQWYMKNIISFYIFYALVLIIIVACVNYLIFHYHLLDLNTDVMDVKSVSLLLLLFMLNHIINSFLGFSAMIYIANNIYYKITYMGNITAILNIVSSITIIQFTNNPLYVALSIVIISLCKEIYILYDVYYSYNTYKQYRFQISFKFILKNLKKSIWFSGLKIDNILIQTVPIFVIQIILGPSFVVIFTIHRTFTNMAIQIKGLIDSTLWRESTILYAQGKTNIINNIYILLQKISSLYFMIILFCFITMGEYIFNIWTNSIEYSKILTYLLMLIAYVKSFSTLSETIAYSRNKIKEVMLIKTVTYTVLLVTLLFFKINNINELLYIFVFTELLSTVLVLIKVNKIMGISNLKIFNNLFLFNIFYLLLIYFNAYISINIALMLMTFAWFYFLLSTKEKSIIKGIF